MIINDGINQEKRVLSVLMAGQSNMAGRADAGEVEPILNERCRVLRMGRWQMMHEPINPDRGVFGGGTRSGVSLAASFADELTRALDEEVGLIPCADGGTSIYLWQPGDLLFDHAVMQAHLAMRTSSLIGIIWHQGESDCKDFDPTDYREKLLNTMRDLDASLAGTCP